MNLLLRKTQSYFVNVKNMIQAIVIFALFCTSHQTDIELEPFEDLIEVTTFGIEENSTLLTVNETTTRVVLKPIEICLLLLNISNNESEQNISDNAYENYLSCLWKSKNLQFHNGKINFTLLEYMINYGVKVCIDVTDIPLLNAEYLASEIIKQCKGITGKTHGEKAIKVRNCLYGKLLYQRKENSDTYDFEDIPYLETDEETCVVKLKLDALEIEDINRRYLVSENNTDFQNFLECYWKDIEFMDKNGTLNLMLLKDKFIEDIQFELLSRSKAVYLADILTKSILNGSKQIKSKDDSKQVLHLQSYISRRLPYFKFLLEVE